VDYSREPVFVSFRISCFKLVTSVLLFSSFSTFVPIHCSTISALHTLKSNSNGKSNSLVIINSCLPSSALIFVFRSILFYLSPWARAKGYFFDLYFFITLSNLLNLSSHIWRNRSMKSAISFIFLHWCDSRPPCRCTLVQAIRTRWVFAGVWKLLVLLYQSLRLSHLLS